jgi:hypothetical protein
MRLLATHNHAFVFIMGSNPNPDEVVAIRHSQRSVGGADPCGPQPPNLLEV